MPRLPDIILKIGDGVFTKDQLVMSVFALVMVGASLSMIRHGKVSEEHESEGARSLFLLPGLGLVVGFVAGFVGAGGGFLIIPALVVLGNIPMAMAVGTSLLIIAANSLVGFSGDVLAGSPMEWGFLVIATAIALVGIFGGSLAARYVPASKLKPVFGWFVLVMGCLVLFSQMRQ